jgi:hypothetical protein
MTILYFEASDEDDLLKQVLAKMGNTKIHKFMSVYWLAQVVMQ